MGEAALGGGGVEVGGGDAPEEGGVVAGQGEELHGGGLAQAGSVPGKVGELEEGGFQPTTMVGLPVMF